MDSILDELGFTRDGQFPILDTVTFETPPISDDKIKDGFNDFGGPVVADVPATHGGFVNKNLVFYTPAGMKDACDKKVWLKPYPKPVLVNHNLDGEPIGRIRTADFIYYGDSNNPLALTTNNQPSCHIQLSYTVVDPEAAQKHRDKRYLTVSIGGHSPDVICSICGKNPLKCGHKRGDRYPIEKGSFLVESNNAKGTVMQCFYYVGMVDYNHLAVVPSPADPNAIISLMETSDSYKSTTHPRVFVYGADTTELFNNKNEIKDEKMSKKLEEILTIDATGGFLTPEQWETLDDLLQKELIESGVIDTKLSTAARKKLKKGTFCGPNRTFPVPDCAHVTAARRLIGRYKGPGNKSSILACVNRKAKALGCNSKSKSEDSQDIVGGANMDKLTLEKILAREDVKKYIEQQVQLALDSNECEGCKMRDQKIANLETQLDELKNSNADSRKTLEEGMKELLKNKDEIQNELDSLKENHVQKVDEIKELTDENKALKQDAHNIRVERIIDIMQTRGEIKATNGKTIKEVRKEVFDKLVVRSAESISDKLNDLLETSGVSTKKIDPSQKVDNPSINANAVGDNNDPSEQNDNNGEKINYKNVVDNHTAQFIPFGNDC